MRLQMNPFFKNTNPTTRLVFCETFKIAFFAEPPGMYNKSLGGMSVTLTLKEKDL